MNRLLTSLIFLCLLSFNSKAQDNNEEMSWRKHRILATELLEKRNYAEAAEHYEKAYKLKPQRLDLLNSAAENYLLVRDFKNAARAFSQLKNMKDVFPMAGLNYALSLKQDEKYNDAIREFNYFISSYEGVDKPFIEDRVHTEVKGCEFAVKQMEAIDNSPFYIEHLPEKVNTLKPEFAPIAYSKELLYFSSMVRGKAKIYRSQKNGSEWSKGRIPRGFTSFQNEHFCNGSFTPDGDRFYFTICESSQAWGALSARCDIYVTMKKGASWKEPVKLPEYINLPNKTNTQPFVTHKNGKEVLYFSTNRSSGQGGMDIWYAEKEINNESTDFTFPVNLGPNVNTKGDEITPFYNTETEALYFSSNGHITMGGFDILKTIGNKATWTNAENLGAPFNSSADDNYFVSIGDASTGFFVSNRKYGSEKMITTQEDIFSFGTRGQEFIVSGIVRDELAKPLEEVFIYLYEFVDEQERRLLSSQTIDHTGAYKFRLLPNKRYQLALQKENFIPSTEYFNTMDANQMLLNRDIGMTRINVETITASSQPIVTKIEKPIKEKIKIVEPAEIVQEASKEIEVDEPGLKPKTEVKETVETLLVQEQPKEVNKETSVKKPMGEAVVSQEEIVKAEVKEIVDKQDVVKIEISNNELNTTIGSIKKEETSIAKDNSTISSPIKNEKIIEDGKEVITFVLSGDEIKSVKIVDGNKRVRYDSDAKPSLQTNRTKTSISTVGQTNVITSTTNSSSNENYRSDFIGKGAAAVPSGTGLYKYDDVNGRFVKEGNNARINATDTRTVLNTNPSVNGSSNRRTVYTTISEAPIKSGTYYKIQMIAVEFYNEDHKRYNEIKKLGKRVDSEFIIEKGWTRVMLADFVSISSARKMLEKVKTKGFKKSYLVKYTNGQRVGRVK